MDNNLSYTHTALIHGILLDFYQTLTVHKATEQKDSGTKKLFVPAHTNKISLYIGALQGRCHYISDYTGL